MIDNLVENREKIAKMGIEVYSLLFLYKLLLGLEEGSGGWYWQAVIEQGSHLCEADPGSGRVWYGLFYEDSTSIEAALKKGQENLKELKDNEEKRDELINKIKDTILDFVLKVFPAC